MLNAAELSDIRKLIERNKLESADHFLQVLDSLFNARTKDPLRVEAQLRALYYDTEGYP